MSPTVDMRKFEQAVQMWTWAQYASARAIADLVEEGIIPKDVAEALLVDLQIFIHPAADTNEVIMQCQYAAAYLSVKRAAENYQTAELMLSQRKSVVHLLCQGADGKTYSPEQMQALIEEVRSANKI